MNSTNSFLILTLLIYSSLLISQNPQVLADDSDFYIEMFYSDNNLVFKIEDKIDKSLNGNEGNNMNERDDNYEYCMIEVDRDNDRSISIMDAQYIVGVTSTRPHAMYLYNYPGATYGFNSSKKILAPHLYYTFPIPWEDLVNSGSENINIKIVVRRQHSITKGDATMFTYPKPNNQTLSLWYKIKVPKGRVKKTKNIRPLNLSNTSIANPDQFGVYVQVKNKYYKMPPNQILDGYAYFMERKSFSRHHKNIPVYIQNTSVKTSFFIHDSLDLHFLEIDNQSVNLRINGPAKHLNESMLYSLSNPLETNNNTQIFGYTDGIGVSKLPEGSIVIHGPLAEVVGIGVKTIDENQVILEYPPLKNGWYGYKYNNKWYLFYVK